MGKEQNVFAVFDYTTFLGASSSKKWTLLEIFSSVVPVLNTLRGKNPQESRAPEERLWQHAMYELSIQESDVQNIIRLLAIAKEEGIDELKLMMPYDLDKEQVQFISEETKAHIHQCDQDEFIVYL